MRKRVKCKSKIISIILLVIILIISINFCINLQNRKIQQTSDWKLVLVNKWNPIQKDYEPKLTKIENGELVDSRIYTQLQNMLNDMASVGINAIVVSGYRTNEEQETIYNEKVSEYISQGYSKALAKRKAKKWVALPGTSEHQTGLAVDINADRENSIGNEVYNWLAENAHHYGFIYRYKANKVDITGIENEPWHYRYVGENAANKIYEQDISLEEYLKKTYR